MEITLGDVLDAISTLFVAVSAFLVYLQIKKRADSSCTCTDRVLAEKGV